ncbi:uncharacterized protein LOC144133867 isoform X1 [Amblyomma americanum]
MSKIFLELGFIVSEEVRQQRDGYSGALETCLPDIPLYDVLSEQRCCRSWKQNGAGKCTVCGHRGSNPQQVLATLARGGCVTRRTADSRSCKPATWQDRECVTSANSLQMPRNLKEGSHPLDDPICATRRPHRR